MSTLNQAQKPKTDAVTNISFYVLMIGLVLGLLLSVGYVVLSFF